jgi:hypothetical protein
VLTHSVKNDVGYISLGQLLGALVLSACAWAIVIGFAVAIRWLVG